MPLMLIIMEYSSLHDTYIQQCCGTPTLAPILMAIPSHYKILIDVIFGFKKCF